MVKIILIIFIAILLLVGIIILQIFLSKRENKWPGLILPIVSGILSIIPVLIIPVSDNATIAQNIILAIIVFLISNIPTIILILIYLACRQKSKNNKEIDKMNIHDLN